MLEFYLSRDTVTGSEELEHCSGHLCTPGYQQDKAAHESAEEAE